MWLLVFLADAAAKGGLPKEALISPTGRSFDFNFPERDCRPCISPLGLPNHFPFYLIKTLSQQTMLKVAYHRFSVLHPALLYRKTFACSWISSAPGATVISPTAQRPDRRQRFQPFCLGSSSSLHKLNGSYQQKSNPL